MKYLLKKYRYSKKRTLYLLVFVVFLSSITIGYSFVSRTLSIEGTTNLTKSTWDVHFNNIQIKSGSVTATTAPAITNDTTVSFAATLEDPGDFYEFNIDLVNAGTINAQIDSITMTPTLTSAQQEYFEYSVTYSDGISIAENHLLEANTTETLTVRFLYKVNEDATKYPEEDQNFSVSVTVNYAQANSNAISKPEPPPVHLPEGRNKDNLQVGDEICIEGSTTECFNFIHYDGDDVVLLSKYNLKVGRNSYESGSFSNPYTSSDPEYGLQDSTMRGWVSGQTTNGVVAFSYTNYWADGTSLKSKYGNAWNTNNIYDDDYSTAPDFSTTCDNSTNCFYTDGYSIVYYVEQYKNTLLGSNYGVNIKEARLLTYEEATDSSIGCSIGSSCSMEFIANTSFWLGSVSNYYSVWRIYSDNFFGYGGFNGNDYGAIDMLGVRPVIVISKSDI